MIAAANAFWSGKMSIENNIPPPAALEMHVLVSVGLAEEDGWPARVAWDYDRGFNIAVPGGIQIAYASTCPEICARNVKDYSRVRVERCCIQAWLSYRCASSVYVE